MSLLRAWHDRCAALFKARKPAALSDVAARLDEHFGPWPEHMGSRADAVAHVEAIGRAKALGLSDALPGTPEHKAYTFVTDQKRYARANSARLPVRQGDSLTGPIDQTHITHYAGQWATHNRRLEHSPRGKPLEVAGSDGEVMTLRRNIHSRKPMQFRVPTVERRMAHMRAAGHAEPFATSDDLRTLHAGVQHAIHAGAVSEADANRYHVMRAAMTIVENDHPESYPGLPFKPSWAAMDTGALRAMHAGAEHLGHAGFADAKERLVPVLRSALSAHDAHPFLTTTSEGRVAVPYPSLHPIGSKKHQVQAMSRSRLFAAADSAQGHAPELTAQASSKPAVKAAAAPESEPAAPSMTWEEYRARSERGEKIDDATRNRLEKEQYEKRKAAKAAQVEKAFAAASLLKAFRAWRREAA